MSTFQQTDASTFEALMTIASGLHGPDAHTPTEHTLHLADGRLDRMRDPKDAVIFLNSVVSWWRTHSVSISWTMPRGPIPRNTLRRMRQMRDAVQALADRDRAGYQRRRRGVSPLQTVGAPGANGAAQTRLGRHPGTGFGCHRVSRLKVRSLHGPPIQGAALNRF